MIEGKPVYVIENGCILLENFDREDVTQEELFSDLRAVGIEQLGQLRTVIVEPNGQLSVFSFKPEEVRKGLPILPNELARQTQHPTEPGDYACCTCGHVQPFGALIDQPPCQRCGQSVWVKAAH